MKNFDSCDSSNFLLRQNSILSLPPEYSTVVIRTGGNGTELQVNCGTVWRLPLQNVGDSVFCKAFTSNPHVYGPDAFVVYGSLIALYDSSNSGDKHVLKDSCTISGWSLNETNSKLTFNDTNDSFISALMTSNSGLIPSADVYCDGTYKGTLDNNNSDKYSPVVTCQPGEDLSLVRTAGDLEGYIILGGTEQ